MIIQNAIKIVENYPEIFYLVSSHVHDFKTYTFKDNTYISVDGGRDYIKRIGDFKKYATHYVDWSLDEKVPFVIIKDRLLWGTMGKSGNGPLIYKLIKDLELDHLKNIVREAKKRPAMFPKIHLKVIKYWIKEKSK